MSRRRRERRQQADRAAARGPEEPTVSLSYRFRRLATPYLLAILSALLVSLAFPPFNVSWFAYVGLVPLLVMAKASRWPRQVLRAAWVGGVFFFGVNLKWLLDTARSPSEALELLDWHLPAWGLLSVYLGLYWGVFAWALRRMNDASRLPATILAPVLWVALEFVRGWMILLGFPWLLMGHTQFANLTLIQIADAVGAYGPSFLIVMTAGLIADVLTQPLFVSLFSRDPKGSAEAGAAGQETRRATPRRLSRPLLAMVALSLAAWAGTIVYGQWRLGQPTRRPGPAVGTVQTCVPQAVKQEARLGSKDVEKEMLDDQILRTRQGVGEAKEAGLPLDLVVWPETMVPGIMNQEFLQDDLAKKIDRERLLDVYRYFQERSRNAWLQVSKLSREIRAPILFGANSSEVEGVQRLPGGRFMVRGPRWNTAFLMTPESESYAVAHTYSKVHLVPFGEYVPFKNSWPWLHEQLMAMSPYDFDYTVMPGDPGQGPFEISYAAGQERREARFQVAICYEDAMAYLIRDMARPAAPGGPKAIDFLVNISNDGWFNGSMELDQHLNLCVFRAVENRLPIVRSVNTGISAIIGSDGRIEKVVEDAGGRRRFIAGQTFGRLELDDRVAPYTRVGDLWAKTCLAASAAGLAWALVRARRARTSAI